MKVLLLLLIVVEAIGLGVRAASQQKNVNVELRAKWTGTPLLLELSEILAKERPDLFWKFTEGWLDAEPSVVSDTSEGCLGEIVSRGKCLVDEPLASVLELSLLARSSSPKLVLYRQLARESLVAHSLLSPSKDVDRWAISENPGPPEGKCCWVDVGSRLLLDEEAILHWVKTPGRSPDVHDADIFDFDHVYPLSGAPKDVAILYGALGTSCFQKYHTILREAAKEGRLKYVLRPVLPSRCEASPCARIGTEKAVKLAGYGVELALKNMEYKAIDDTEVSTAETKDDAKSEDLMQEARGFIFSKLLERKPHLTAELMTFRDHLLSSDISESMNVWELKDLGYQAAQRIVGASEPLRLMQELNQNFPSLVSSLSRMKLNDTIKEEIVINQQTVTPGRTLLGINGALLNPENLDLFSLIDIVQGELSFADKLVKMKVPSDAISKLLKLPEAAEKNTFRLEFRSKEFVHFLNDIETDAKYRRWRLNLNELLMPLFPGQMRYIRKNLYHAVYVIDPASMSGLKMVETILLYYENNLPMRFGLIFLSPKLMKLVESGDVIDHAGEDDLSSLVIRLFLYIRDHDSLHAAFEFLNSIVSDNEEVLEDGVVEEARIEEAFLEFLSGMPKTKSMELFEMLKQGKEYREDPLKATQFVFKLGLSQMYPSILVNGRVYGPSQVQSALMMAMNEELQNLQEAVYFGQIDSGTDVLDKLLSDEGFSRYNPKIVGSNKDAKFIGLAVPVIENHPVVSRLQYLHSPGTEDDVKPVTHWVIVDLTRKSGVQLLGQGLHYLMQGSSRGRLAVLHNIENEETLVEGSTQLLLLRVVNLLIRSPSRRAKHLALLHKVLSTCSNLGFDEAFESFLDLAAANDLDVKKLKTSLSESAAGTIKDQFEDRSFVSSLFGLKPGTMAIVTNGRVVVQEEQHLIAEDFSLLEQLEYRRRKDLKEIIEQVSWDTMEPDEVTSEFFSTVLMVASSAMSSRVRSSDTANFHLLQAEHSAIVRQVENSFLQIDAVMNPLSPVAQRLTPLLLLLDEWLQPGFRVVLNPMNSLADVPLKNFYRYVLPSRNEFRQGGSGHSARFTSMPPSRTLTMNLDIPEPWLVEPVVAVHDLDNIVLEKLGGERTLNAVFELEALMITGHCHEHNEPPRGLQLILGTKQAPHMVDTIVMANLGYFQLKAAPGAWDLKLADGRSSELYTLSGPKEGTDEGSLSRRVIVGDLRGQLVHLNVVKRLGKENEKLLEADGKQARTGPNAKGGFFNWLTGGAKRVDAPAKRDETINIFSIASGHLYERFLKIMILSVLKNTHRPVKFWFIKNYLSPQFKDLIPHMAANYNFQYELITYKWPTFLHKQTEKQRIIWAYKILFLDVIFPLSLKKVIFVDADQIVRADMGELYDMDIKGRPLAYTPFCDNNKEMDGYRFWRQGFWQEHLQGRPYHISALYVVDLDKFRQTAAGDNLRVFYESLSRDPNSLSNLDQDLPNYAQHTVPIFSLPQEWLWCESWCGNATKDKAKTIDLCNNPMTKEPKLQGARRIVKEWPALDEEARQFTREILGNDDDQQPQQQAAVADATAAAHHPSDSQLKDEL